MNGGPPSLPVRAFVLRPSYLTQNLEIRGSNPFVIIPTNRSIYRLIDANFIADQRRFEREIFHLIRSLSVVHCSVFWQIWFFSGAWNVKLKEKYVFCTFKSWARLIVLKLDALIRANPSRFLSIFVLLGQKLRYRLKKHICCAGDLNPGHWAMAAATSWMLFYPHTPF